MEASVFLKVAINCQSDFIEIFIAELSDLNYDSMLETEVGLEAYIKKDHFEEQELLNLQEKYSTADLTYKIEEVVEKNWNEEWERNYDPIRVEDKILVRATFHEPDPAVEYDLLITPKMSFGTGHHATTYLMLKHQLEVDHKNKRVLDAGCGTAILAVMAEKLGAADIVAYDIDSWSVENAPENVALNNCEHIQVLEGTIESAGIEGEFDIILANINKNVLLQEMPEYEQHLKVGGTIIFSGFYTSDDNDIKGRARECNFIFQKGAERNDWSSLIFEKRQ